MKYVIDSSVAFKWSVKEVDSDKAEKEKLKPNPGRPQWQVSPSLRESG